MIGLVALSVSAPFESLFVIYQKPHIWLTLYGVGVVINTLVSIALLQNLGVYAGAIGSAVSFTIMSVLVLKALRRIVAM